MSQLLASRANNLPTVGDVVQGLRDDAALSPHRRQDMVSACNTVARVLGRQLTDLPADAILLRRPLAAASPLAAGVSLRRWHNVRSLFGKAIATVVPLAPRRCTGELMPEWRELQRLLRGTSFDRSLSSLIRFASERRMVPGEIGQSEFHGYRAHLLSSLRCDPEKTYRLACVGWNKAADAISGWPQFRVIRPSRKGAWVLDWSVFPSALRDEVQAEINRSMDDLLAGIFLRPLRESTKIARDYHCRVAASALTCEDVNPQSITSLEHLTSLEAYQKILGHLIKRHGGTAGGQIGHIAKLLQRTARDRCNATDEQLKRMSAMLKRVWKPQTGMTERNREHLWQFEDAAAVAALVELPLRLAEEARRARSPRDALRKMELALAIDLLLMTAMRIGNLSRLDTERHFIRTRRGNHVLIAIGAQETKNDFGMEFPLPERTVGLVDSCQRYRKQALAYETTALFPGRGCGSRHPTAFGLQIKKTVKAYTGLTINPHLFRHLGAKLYLEANPGSYGVVRLMLGHQSVATTERFYTGTERIAAIRHFQNFILGCSR